MSRKILWVDIEATGLSPTKDRILEVGLRITDWQGATLDQVTSLVWNDDWRERLTGNSFVLNMHTESGLVADLDELSSDPYRVKLLPNLVGDMLVAWCVQRLTPEEFYQPMAGNSVHYDRSFLVHWMPNLHNVWNYRNIDISSTREQCRISNPALFAKIPQQAKAHRPQQDIDASIKLWEWLLDNFLWPEPVEPAE